MIWKKLTKYIDSTSLITFLIFSISLIVMATGDGRSPIYILDESKNAQCAWEMLNSDDHIIPTFNGKLRTDKPPLHYYIIMAGYLIFGKSAFAARIFSSLAGAVFMVILFRFVTRYSGVEVAFWTIAVLLSSILWVAEFHLAVPDPYLIVLSGSGLMTFFHFFETKKRSLLPVMYILFSLGFMAKGPVAVFLPGLAILIYIAFRRQLNWKMIKSLAPVTGLLIFILISAPWYLTVNELTNQEWTRGFFLDHNLNRFTATREGHGGSFLVTLSYFALGMLPFIVFAWGIIKNLWREREESMLIFSSIVTLVFLLFFSISRTKLPNYTMPCFPFAAIITAYYLARIYDGDKTEQMNIRIGLWILLIISVMITLSLTFGVAFEPLVSHMKTLGLLFIFMPVGIIAAMVYEYRFDYRKSLTTVFLTFFLSGLVYNNVLLPSVNKNNPVSLTIEKLNSANTVKYYGRVNPAYIFNYGKIDQLKDLQQVKYFLSDSSNILITSGKTILESSSFWEDYDIIYAQKDLFDTNKTVILKSNSR